MYTPTTEWVIAGWMKARASDGVTADVALEEINRWLAEVKAQERKAERERTIKLLEDTPATRTTWIDDGISVYALDKDDFIALIKGEEQ